MEIELLKKFHDNNITMWNPNTNYLTYLKHFEKILNYCIDNKTYTLTYAKWLDLLNTDNSSSKIGAETHNICHGLNIINSTYKYSNISNPETIIITVPRNLLFQYLSDDRNLSDEFWKIIQNRYLKFLRENNIFELNSLSHIQRVSFNLFVCYLLNTKKIELNKLTPYVRFAKDTIEEIDNKILKVYNFDVCKPSANILEKLEISSEGIELKNSEEFIKSLTRSLEEEKTNILNEDCSHYIISIKNYSTYHKKYFDKYGYMYWEEGLEKKYHIGDIIYLYFSTDNEKIYSRIKKKAIITDINIPKERLEEEKYFENFGLTTEAKYFIRVKLIGDTDSSDLSYKNLNEKFGFSVPQLGSSLIQNNELINYIESYFNKNNKDEKTLTEETLGVILRSFYNSEYWNKSTGIMLFGIKYGEYIMDKKLNKEKIVEFAGLNESYLTELNKAVQLKDHVQSKYDIKKVDLSNIERKTGGFNSIYYGIPGCGKSYVAGKAAEKHTGNANFIVRTTFYPDYTNSDFIGQIIPKIDDNNKNSVLYDIQGGPFVDALVMAIDNPSNYVCLIIEEINRGNAAAIFGDLFQLLDRKENGTSEYSIKNYTITKYLEKHCINSSYDFEKIVIPSNLILIGTMNTSDQNVFTLDTAYKRRWELKHIVNDIDNSKYANNIVPILNIKWKDFVKEINYLITHNEDSLGINGEDKQLGAYFISGQEWNKINKLMNESNFKESGRIFAEKVLSYIWEDVAKIDKKSMFNKDYKTFDEVINDFLKDGNVLNINIGRD